MQVLLALHGSMGRSITSQWLRKNGICTLEASDWNELTQILGELFRGRNSARNKGFVDTQCSLRETLKAELPKIYEMRNPYFVMVVDIGLLDLSTDIWREQLNFLDKYSGKANFAWVLNHDTSNAIKMELRRKGYLLMVNRPLYKAKVIHILEAVIKERYVGQHKRNSNGLRTTCKERNSHECLEIDSTQFETASSDDSDTSEMGNSKSTSSFLVEEKKREKMTKACSSKYQTVNNCLVELTEVYPNENDLRKKDPQQSDPNSLNSKDAELKFSNTRKETFLTEPDSENPIFSKQDSTNSPPKEQGKFFSSKAVKEQKSLEGLHILLAEDTPVLQRVASIMLEKMRATVTVVGDGLQAVEALNSLFSAKENENDSHVQDAHENSEKEIWDRPPYDLILMDCQVT